MKNIAENCLKHLNPAFGNDLLIDLATQDIERYQKARLDEGASSRSVNIELGVLRGVCKKFNPGLWERLKVEMLPEHSDAGHALMADEEARLVEACGKSRNRALLPFVVLALESGARYGTLHRLQWRNVDFSKRCLTFGKDKTVAGSGRTIPLLPRALETLKFWSQSFPQRKPDHYVFPYERYAGAGEDETFGFSAATIYDHDATKPAGSLKTAWHTARKRAGLEHFRIHDLRHSAASRMIAGGVPLPIVAKILGWKPSTAARMASRYGHFTVEDMRTALEAMPPTRPETPLEPPNEPPNGREGKTERIN